jgi:hypothetical protein
MVLAVGGFCRKPRFANVGGVFGLTLGGQNSGSKYPEDEEGMPVRGVAHSSAANPDQRIAS